MQFDVLSESAIENIVRHLSETPHSDKWYINFPSSRLEILLQLGGGLSDATRSAFRKLTLDEKFFRDIADNEPERQRLVLMVVEALGSKLRRLDLHFLGHGVELIMTKTARCTALRNLTLSIHSQSELASFSDFLAARGLMLEVLDIHFAILSKPDVLIILKCTALQRLTLS